MVLGQKVYRQYKSLAGRRSYCNSAYWIWAAGVPRNPTLVADLFRVAILCIVQCFRVFMWFVAVVHIHRRGCGPICRRSVQ